MKRIGGDVCEKVDDVHRRLHRGAPHSRQAGVLDERGVTFRWKDYRVEGPTRHKTMTLDAGEFMRRFLLHVLPSRFHRIRHYGLLANASRKDNIVQARQLLQPTTDASSPTQAASPEPAPLRPTFVCRHCGAAMTIIDTFERGQAIRGPPGAGQHER